jgi:hypothetical protein
VRESGHLNDIGVDGSIIIILIFNKWNFGLKWIELHQNMDRWRALVKAEIQSF